MPSSSDENHETRGADESQEKRDERIHPAPTVVGIGASAGGLAALKALFAHVPVDSGLAFVVVVHLSPDHESHFAELLQPHMLIPVQQVTETTPLQANHVYVIPPGCNLSAVDTHLRLSDLEERRSERLPIDHFFRTLAQTHDGSSIAIVLTGTGSDGTLGIGEVKRQNGLTVAQEPKEAEFDGMPLSAVKSGLVDLVLPLAEIPDAIIRYTRTRPRLPDVADLSDTEGAERNLLQQVFGLLISRTHRDFSRYKRATILRRITRRMQMAHLDELGAYVKRLREQPDEVVALADDLLITITTFFRDEAVFEALATDVLPGLFEGRGPDEKVRAWSVGCATGEEAYSLAILLLEEAARHESPPHVQVFASDLHEKSLRRAREAVYPDGITADVSAERLARFFTKVEGGYRVGAEVREHVVFAPHNLLSDPPFSKLDLVSCRNVMIYFQRDVQQDVMDLFHYALQPQGVIVLGTSESAEASELFRTVDERHRVYRKRNVPTRAPRLPVFPMTWDRGRPPLPASKEPPGEPVDYAALHRHMVETIASPSLLLSVDDKVVHLSENVGRYLTLPGGEITANAFKLVREELRVELQTALHAARMQGESVRSRAVPVVLDGDARTVVLHVSPAALGTDGYTLVVFEERSSATPDRPVQEEEGSRLAAVVAERDVALVRLQKLIGIYENGQEEMRAANEELQSANEELRSTMEELETSKEELQSMNEELHTVNQEYRDKVEELAQLSSDLANLLEATDIATLFLDRSLCILRFTPQVGELFNVRQSDCNRPLSDLTNQLGYDEILIDAETVLQTLEPIEREVRDAKGRWYLARVLPYRSAADQIEGVVLTFIEITERVRAEATVRASEERLREMAETVPDVLFTGAPDGTIDYASSQIKMLLGTPPDALLGTQMWPDLVHPDDRVRAQDAWAEATHTKSPYEVRYRLRNVDGTYCWVIVRARPVIDELGALTRWYGSMITDVAALTQAEQEVKALNASLEARVEERTARIRELSARLVTAEQKERQRLAHVLHDDLQQQLAALAMTLQLLRSAPSKDRQALWVQADRIVDTSTELTRSLSSELSPPVLASTDLGDTLRWLAELKRNQFHLEVDVQVDGVCEVPDPTIRAALYQSLREILLNVLKHARTRRATLRCYRDGDQIVTVVEDEGDGFDPSKVRMTGLGLFSARERIAGLGGHLDVDSEPGRGTRITLTIPAGGSDASCSSEKASMGVPERSPQLES